MFGIAANPDKDREALAKDFAEQRLPWNSLVYPEVKNASKFGRTGGDVAGIFCLVDPNGEIRFKRVVPFGEDSKVTQKMLDRQLDILCREFSIKRSN